MMDTIGLQNMLLEVVPRLKDIGDSIQSTLTIVDSAAGKDIKLGLDRILHEKITSMLQSLNDFPVLSEEEKTTLDFTQKTQLQWIIDPLDGSLNHFRGIPLCCISIALWKGQEPVMGIIYDYNLKEMFTGVVGKGAWLNDKPISVSNLRDVRQAVLCTGFPSYRDYKEESLRQFISQIQRWKKVRLFGSAALSLAYVACGRVDGYIEEDIRIWDVAAGLAIVKAASGEVYCNSTGRPNFVTAAATNGKISIGEIVK